MEEPQKWHFYNLCFIGVNDNVTLWSNYITWNNVNIITRSCIRNCEKMISEKTEFENLTFVSASYLGEMTKEEFEQETEIITHEG